MSVGESADEYNYRRDASIAFAMNPTPRDLIQRIIGFSSPIKNLDWADLLEVFHDTDITRPILELARNRMRAAPMILPLRPLSGTVTVLMLLVLSMP